LVAGTGGGVGGVGVVFGGEMQDERSKKRNSSAFACGLIGLALHSDG
jgi:hypothetical protein